MSTKLEVVVSTSDTPDEAGVASVVGRVIRNETGVDQQFIIPTSGSLGDGIMLEQGSYTIEARMPSGSLVSHQVQVKGNEPTLRITFTDHVESDRKLVSKGLESIGLESMRPEPGVVSLIAVKRMHPECWFHLAELVRRRAMPALHEIEVALNAAQTTTLTPASENSRGTRDFIVRDASAQYDVQHILVVQREGVVELVPLPVPWQTRRGNLAEIRVTVPIGPRKPLKIVVRDPDFGIMINYLGAGALVDAHAVLESSSAWSAIETLQDKLENPFAAAIAGCVLVLAETSGDHQRWDSWLENLEHTFQHLPDAAIVRATRLLRKSSPDPHNALASLVHASRIGIPIFAPIAALFLDGLTTLVPDPDFNSGVLDERLFNAVRVVMMCVQSGQALTIIRLETPHA